MRWLWTGTNKSKLGRAVDEVSAGVVRAIMAALTAGIPVDGTWSPVPETIGIKRGCCARSSAMTRTLIASSTMSNCTSSLALVALRLGELEVLSHQPSPWFQAQQEVDRLQSYLGGVPQRCDSKWRTTAHCVRGWHVHGHALPYFSHFSPHLSSREKRKESEKRERESVFLSLCVCLCIKMWMSM